jgi:hypothetical protein
LFFCDKLHPRAGGEMVRQLGAAVEHDAKEAVVPDNGWGFSKNGIAGVYAPENCCARAASRGPFMVSASVEGCGCRPIAAMRLAPWAAAESLQ